MSLIPREVTEWCNKCEHMMSTWNKEQFSEVCCECVNNGTKEGSPHNFKETIDRPKQQ